MGNIIIKNQSLFGELTRHFFASCKSERLLSTLIFSGYVTKDGRDFTEEGKRIFLSSNHPPVFFRYISYSGHQIDDAVTKQGSFFEQFLAFLDAFMDLVPSYEDRSSIERIEEKEISKDLFVACLAKQIINEDVRSGVVFAEQADSFGRIVLRSFRTKPQQKEAQSFVSFLKGVGLISWFFYSKAKQGVERGLVKERISSGVSETTIFYYSYARKEGILNRSSSYLELTPSELQIMEVAETYGVFKRDDVLFKTGMSPKTASFSLSSLVNKGVLIRHGELGRRNSSYSLAPSYKSDK